MRRNILAKDATIPLDTRQDLTVQLGLLTLITAQPVVPDMATRRVAVAQAAHMSENVRIIPYIYDNKCYEQ
jgi:hypothetical protein